jgi:hypothetical protein
VNAVAISPAKPLDGLSLINITGTCTKGITLANISGAVLHGIQVTGYSGALLGTNNVSGTGLDGAVTIPPTAAGPPVVPATGSNIVGRAVGNTPTREAP